MIYEPVLYPDKEQQLAVDLPPGKPRALSICSDCYNNPHVLDVGTSRNRSGKDNCLLTNGGVSLFTRRSESPNG
ncbi:hypothetical protein M514_14292 [Trichuris suis]|uniref:Uncharacterized protein n=1 Tax=Trichuris suis TaxID=68888 RepID=A0A085MPM8_9BILA|nr:hypothetical protein M514_14292 [Trichuris suis]